MSYTELYQYVAKAWSMNTDPLPSANNEKEAKNLLKPQMLKLSTKEITGIKHFFALDNYRKLEMRAIAKVVGWKTGLVANRSIERAARKLKYLLQSLTVSGDGTTLRDLGLEWNALTRLNKEDIRTIRELVECGREFSIKKWHDNGEKIYEKALAMGFSEPQKHIDPNSISSLNLPIRLENILRKAGFETISELAQSDNFYYISGIGSSGYQNLIEAIESKGFKIASVEKYRECRSEYKRLHPIKNEIELPSYVLKALMRAGINSLDDLLKQDELDLLGILSEKSVEKIKESLAKIGKTLANKPLMG